ncbi:MAG: NAD(P)-dependent oxidoreductase [Pseudorhodoplanes sp.]|nr:2-hydroxy-3-oxopropionate reductase [Pseudorhodoplanes sp.]MBW7948956.1 NAD(P)-dependent oxidoreductase [Pseudorhodoplanes sp.]
MATKYKHKTRRAAARPKGRVGIIGLGIMGGAFARNLVAAGWDVTGFDIRASACRTAKAAGVAIAGDAAAVTARCPVIITSLPDPHALHETVAALAAAARKPLIVAEASTFALDDKMKAERTLRAAGHIMLDCPVSGTGAQARVKDIVVYASGERAAIRKLKPLFAGFAREVSDLGAFGNGSRMKYVANLLVAIHNVASAEAMVLGMKAGLDPVQIVKFVGAGAGNSRIFALRAPMMAKNSYGKATMKLAVWRKDMAIISALARKIGVPTPLLDAAQPVYAQAVADGRGAQDTAAVCAVLEKAAGLRRARKR